MSAHRSPTTRPPAEVDLLDQAVRYTLDSLRLVTFDALWSPTPCQDWNLSDLLSHLGDSLAALLEAAEIGRIAVRPAPIPRAFDVNEVVDPVVVLEDQAGRLREAWTDLPSLTPLSVSGHPITVHAVAEAGAVEIAVHGWDVAASCGAPRPIPEELAFELLARSAVWVTPTDRRSRFAAPRRLPQHASTNERLLAFLGRDPRG